MIAGRKYMATAIASSINPIAAPSLQAFFYFLLRAGKVFGSMLGCVIHTIQH
jgi:hypothetical protein